jgi:hypothetical protein
MCIAEVHCWDTGWRARIKGSIGMACLGLGTSDKVTLAIDSCICIILAVACLTVWSDWPPCFTVASILSAVVMVVSESATYYWRELACPEGTFSVNLMLHSMNLCTQTTISFNRPNFVLMLCMPNDIFDQNCRERMRNEYKCVFLLPN